MAEVGTPGSYGYYLANIIVFVFVPVNRPSQLSYIPNEWQIYNEVGFKSILFLSIGQII